MSVTHAVLGLLLQRQSYPYELGTLFEERVGPVWDVNRGQIYAVVERLEKEGLIERVDKRPSGRGPKWTYRATARGEKEFKRWFMRRPDNRKPHRDELFVKLALSTPHDVEHLVETVARRERLCTDRLEEYADLHDMLAHDEHTGGWEYAWPALIVKAAVTQLDAELGWLREVRAKLVLFAAAPAVARRDRTAIAPR